MGSQIELAISINITKVITLFPLHEAYNLCKTFIITVKSSVCIKNYLTFQFVLPFIMLMYVLQSW